MILLAALLLAAPAPAEDRNLEHWRLLFPDDRVEAFDGEARPPDEQLVTATGGWAWRDGEAPRPARSVGGKLTLGEVAATEGLEVRVRGPKKKPSCPESLELVAAPRAMWEQVPEPLLPRHACVAGSASVALVRERGVPYRIRLLAGAQGSAWVDAPPQRKLVEVELAGARDRRIRVTGADGAELPTAELHILGVPETELLARFAPATNRIEVPALPEPGPLAWIFSAPGHLPRRLDLHAEGLPTTLRLEPSFTVRGRIVDEASRPIAEVEVSGAAELASGSLLEVVRETRTDPSGRFDLGGLPAGGVRLVGRKSGFGSLAATVELPARVEGLDLGTIVMRRGVPLRVAVRDGKGMPISGASVRTRPELGAPVTTDAKGGARVDGATPGSEVELEITAEGFLPGHQRARVAAEREVIAVLRAAFRLRGRFVDAGGAPVERASARVALGSQVRSRPLAADGELTIDLPPGQGGRLTLASPRTAELVVDFEPGAAGEVRDLGDLRAPPSRRVVGTVVDAGSGEPLAGARVAAPRPDGRHPMESWFFGRWLETRSDADGHFELAGLAELPVRLEIAALRHATRAIEFTPRADEEVTDLGTIALAAGASVVVRVPDLDPEVPEASVEVRLDPSGRWQEYELYRAPLVAGEARFFDVAPGRVLVTAMAQREVLCETEVEVASDSEEAQEFDCRSDRLEVAGLVRVGREPSGAGLLVWLSGEPSGPGFIVDSSSSLGGIRSSIVGGGRPQVDVPVLADGRFVSKRLRPGPWNVLWSAERQGVSRPVAVDIPDQEGRIELVLDFAAGELEGRVVDPDGAPLAGATVTEKVSGATTVSGEDGQFRLLGLEPGTLLVQAERRSERSSVKRVSLDEGGTPPPVELVVPSEDEREAARIRVEGVDGAPIPGAFLFAQSSRGETRILTTGPEGVVSLELEPPVPDAVRFAVLRPGAGLLGEWVPWDGISGEEIVLRPGLTAELVVGSEGQRHSVELFGPGGWNVGELLLRLGIPLVAAPGSPLALASLPPGDYVLRAAEGERSLALRSGESTGVMLSETDAQ